MSSTAPLSHEELAPAAVLVRQEYDSMRVATTGVMELYGATRSRALVRDLFVMALNVKARNLLHFFESPTTARPDDVVASLYIDGWSPGDVGFDLAYLRSVFAPGVNKRLLHLTARSLRVDDDADAVPVAEIYWTLAGMMQRFMERLDVERRPWFCPDGSEPDTSLSALGLHPVGSREVDP